MCLYLFFSFVLKWICPENKKATMGSLTFVMILKEMLLPFPHYYRPCVLQVLGDASHEIKELLLFLQLDKQFYTKMNIYFTKHCFPWSNYMVFAIILSIYYIDLVISMYICLCILFLFFSKLFPPCYLTSQSQFWLIFIVWFFFLYYFSSTDSHFLISSLTFLENILNILFTKGYVWVIAYLRMLYFHFWLTLCLGFEF